MVCVDNYEAYPGIFRVSFDSGDPINLETKLLKAGVPKIR